MVTDRSVRNYTRPCSPQCDMMLFMARPRSFNYELIVTAATDVFWERGFEGTALPDLERATGLSRSSLYLAFQAKSGLFDAALNDYEHRVIDVLLGPVEAKGAGLEEISGFFLKLASLFRQPSSQRGCLQINSIAELAGRAPQLLPKRGARFANRYRSAFLNALSSTGSPPIMDRAAINRRSELLTSAAMGAWVAVRASNEAAVRTCRAVAAEIDCWKTPSLPGPRRR